MLYNAEIKKEVLEVLHNHQCAMFKKDKKVQKTNELATFLAKLFEKKYYKEEDNIIEDIESLIFKMNMCYVDPYDYETKEDFKNYLKRYGNSDYYKEELREEMYQGFEEALELIWGDMCRILDEILKEKREKEQYFSKSLFIGLFNIFFEEHVNDKIKDTYEHWLMLAEENLDNETKKFLEKHDDLIIYP